MEIHFSFVHRDDGVSYMEVRQNRTLVHSDQPSGIGNSGQRVRIDVGAEHGYVSQGAIVGTLSARLGVKDAFDAVAAGVVPVGRMPFVLVNENGDKLVTQVEKTDGVGLSELEGYIKAMEDRISALSTIYLP